MLITGWSNRQVGATEYLLLFGVQFLDIIKVDSAILGIKMIQSLKTPIFCKVIKIKHAPYT